MYYIGTGTKYIATRPDNTVYVTEDLSKARRYASAQRAGNALVTLPRKMYEISSKWAVREDVTPAANEDEVTAVEKTNSEKTVAEKTAEMTDAICEESNVDFVAMLKDISDLKAQRKGCLTRLQGELSSINEEITDIEHFIEFSKLNAPNGYNAYKMLRDALQKRRIIKDNIRAANEIYNNCDVDKIYQAQEQLNNRIYKPRRLDGLFANLGEE